MTPAELNTLQKVHGALAWASVAGLAAACVAVWRGRVAARPEAGGPEAGEGANKQVRGARMFSAWIVPVAAVLGAATFVTGAALHGPFQGKLRQRLFLASETLGWLFERKEHAAFGALALSLSALFATWAERAARGRPAGSAEARAAGMLRRAAIVGLSAALVLSALSLAVSVAVARRASF